MEYSKSLYDMLSVISSERTKPKMSAFHLEDSDEDQSFWVDFFQTNFVLRWPIGPDDSKDDMLFYVFKVNEDDIRNSSADELSSEFDSLNDVKVYRRDSKLQPVCGDYGVDWEQTVYLNLILQQFEYTLTCAVCSRTSEKELQIMKKTSHKLFATPSRRRMDSKGTEEVVTYPNIFFIVDNYEELYSDMIVRDSEMVCVELIASDRFGHQQTTIFLGSIRYDALKRVYDSRGIEAKQKSEAVKKGARSEAAIVLVDNNTLVGRERNRRVPIRQPTFAASLTTRMSRSMNMFSPNPRRVEFVRMRGPDGKGYAEMAVCKSQNDLGRSESFSGYTSRPAVGRRLSDPHRSFMNFKMTKSQSEAQNVESIFYEIKASHLTDEFHEDNSWGHSFGTAWQWFKERKRAQSIPLTAHLTYVSLPWHRIIADVLDVKQPPVLTF